MRVAARLGVGIGESTCSPACQSLIGDLFPPEKRSRALGAFMLGLPFGLVLRIPGVSALADFAYDKVAKNRTAISVWFGYDACGVGEKIPAPGQGLNEPIPELA